MSGRELHRIRKCVSYMDSLPILGDLLSDVVGKKC